jgi:hypothetical protein
VALIGKRNIPTDLRVARSRNCVVDIATGYGLEDRGVGIQVPVGAIYFNISATSIQYLIKMGTEGYYPGGNAAET